MNKEAILLQGIETLCTNDIDIGTIIAPNRDQIVSLLNRYINEIELFNPAYGLVGTNDTEELVIKHILDSLAPLGILSRLLSSLRDLTPLREPLPKILRIADAGSGAGLPGIPLAIAMPHCEFSLIERIGRRAGFLHNTKAALSLSNIIIEESEIEKAAGGRFDLVTFRAFKPLEPKMLKTLFSLCAPGGIITAYKGRMEKIQTEMVIFKEQIAKKKEQSSEIKWEAIPYNVPFLEEERHILVIRE